MNSYFQHILIIAAMVALPALTAGCATTQPYIASDVGAITLNNSANHQFKYVRAYQKDNHLVLYGKIHHSHEGGHEGEVVVLKSTTAKGTDVYTNRIALRPQSNHQRGWYGAGFRVKIDADALQNGHLSLSFIQ